MTDAAARSNIFDPHELAKLPEEKIRALMAAAKRKLAARKARRSLIDFARFMRPDPQHYGDPDYSRYSVQGHHQLLGELLMKLWAGEFETQNVLISMPPQHGKSDIISRLGLAYHTGNYPWRHVLFGAYNQDFAEEFGDDVRSLLAQQEYSLVFPNVRLRTGSKARNHMVTEDGGKLSFIGRGGSGTGRPADGMLIDDPIKDAKEAASLTIRNDVWDWFVRVMNTRCHVHSWKVIVQTRWSEDDLIGRLTDPTNPHYNADVAKQWTYINIPALMDNAEIAAALGKKVGDALWPERFPVTLLENARRLDPVAFSALYMGRPTPPEGAFFKLFMLKGYDKPLPADKIKSMRYYLTGDLAVSTERTADKSCCGVWGVDERDDLWLMPDLYWDRKNSDESVDKIIQFCKTYKLFEGFFEKGQLDKAIGPFLEKRMKEERVYVPITRMPVTGNKGARATSMRGRMAQGRVHFPVFAPWWPAAKDQILKFTGSGDDKEDDFVDMMALIGQALGEQIPGEATSEPKSNVIRVGTLAWIKKASNEEARRRKVARMLARA